MSQTPPRTILLVDDIEENLTALENLLEGPGRKFIKATNGKDAIKYTMNNTVDLILLDVHMPGMDGYEVAEILKASDKTRQIPIIFVTAISKEHQHVMKGYAEGAVDYLIKPLDPQITRSKVSALLELVEPSSQHEPTKQDEADHIFVKTGSKYIKLKFDDIIFFEAEGDYVMIHFSDQKHVVHTTMKSLEDKLPPHQFMRIHRSYIVNLDKITSIHDYIVKAGEKTLSIGKSYQQKVMKQLHRL